MKEALLYQTKEQNRVKCDLCPHNCLIPENGLGVCRVRKNIKGKLYSLNFDRVAAIHSDPIEKKPLYHFLPASTSLSIAAMGCNFRCQFCQNHTLSMVTTEENILGTRITPDNLVESAIKSEAESISYTYTEPTIYFELMLETARLTKKANLKNVMVSNGYTSLKALEMIMPYMDAANIDLKAFTDSFYQKYCGARLAPVLDTIKTMKRHNIWIEVTTLLIPDLNDDEKQIKDIITFLLSVDENIPWHVSRFFPQHQMLDTRPTDPDSICSILESAHEMGLKYLYSGNTIGNQWSNTLCPKCRTTLINRDGYNTIIRGFSNGICKKCNQEIAGFWG